MANLIWVDKLFGLKNVEGMMSWLKVSNRLKNEDSAMAEALATYFEVSQSVVEALVKTPGNLIADNIEVALSRRS